MGQSNRAYHNNYYRTNAKRRAKIREYSKNAIVRNKLYVDTYLKEHPCLVCGECDILVLEFDHREPEFKGREISVLVHNAASIQRLQEEIAKCDVLCANCHRRKTHKQLNWT